MVKILHTVLEHCNHLGKCIFNMNYDSTELQTCYEGERGSQRMTQCIVSLQDIISEVKQKDKEKPNVSLYQMG